MKRLPRLALIFAGGMLVTASLGSILAWWVLKQSELGRSHLWLAPLMGVCLVPLVLLFTFAKAAFAQLLCAYRREYFDELLGSEGLPRRGDFARGLVLLAGGIGMALPLAFMKGLGPLAAEFVVFVMLCFALFAFQAFALRLETPEPELRPKVEPAVLARGWALAVGVYTLFPVGTAWLWYKLTGWIGAAYRLFRDRWRRSYLTPEGDLPDAEPGESLLLPFGKLTSFDKTALVLVGLVLLLLAVSLRKFEPAGWDTWYHMSVARRIFDTGHIPLWDNWEFAPEGRPHLYPPLLHLLIAWVGRLFGHLESGLAFLHVVVFPSALLTTWYFTRRLFGSVAAFAALLLMLTDMLLFALMNMPIASTLCNVLAPLLVLLVVQRKIGWGILVCTLMLYSHLGIPILVILGLGLFVLLQRQYLKSYLAVVIPSLVLFSPWLVRVWQYRDWLNNFAHKMAAFDQFKLFLLSIAAVNLLVVLFVVWGLVNLSWRKPRHYLPVTLAIGLAPLLPTYGGRYFMHAAPFFTAIAGFALAPYLAPPWNLKLKAKVVALLLIPQLTVMGFAKKPFVVPLPTGFELACSTVVTPSILGKEQALGKDGRQLIAYVKQHARPGEIVHVDEPWIGDMLATYLDVRQDKAAWWEVGKKGAAAQTKDKHLLSTTGILVVQKTERLPKGTKPVHFGRFYVAVVRHDETP